jgi:hypothetical protein
MMYGRAIKGYACMRWKTHSIFDIFSLPKTNFFVWLALLQQQQEITSFTSFNHCEKKLFSNKHPDSPDKRSAAPIIPSASFLPSIRPVTRGRKSIKKSVRIFDIQPLPPPQLFTFHKSLLSFSLSSSLDLFELSMLL